MPPRAAVRACARALGDARDAYATADTVADLDALRAALGDARWVLAGVSYGSFVAAALRAGPPRPHARPRAGLRRAAGGRRAARARAAARDRPRAAGRLPRRGRAVRRRSGRRPRRAAAPRGRALGPPLFDTLTALSIGVPRLARRARDAAPRAGAATAAPLQRLARRGVHGAEAAPRGLLSQGLHAATLCADSPAPWGGPQAGRGGAGRARWRAYGPRCARPTPRRSRRARRSARACW